MNDIEIRNYEEKIIETINSVPLPLEIKRLIVWDIYQKVEIATNQAMEQQQKEKEESKDGNSDAERIKERL